MSGAYTDPAAAYADNATGPDVLPDPTQAATVGYALHAVSPHGYAAVAGAVARTPDENDDRDVRVRDALCAVGRDIKTDTSGPGDPAPRGSVSVGAAPQGGYDFYGEPADPAGNGHPDLAPETPAGEEAAWDI